MSPLEKIDQLDKASEPREFSHWLQTLPVRKMILQDFIDCKISHVFIQRQQIAFNYGTLIDFPNALQLKCSGFRCRPDENLKKYE